MKNKGFTLVEIICAIVILSIVAAVAMPAMSGYNKKTKVAEAETYARQVYLAAQSGVRECYAEDAFKNSATMYMNDGVRVGRLSNSFLYYAQAKKTPDMNVEQQVHYKLAKLVLKKLNSYEQPYEYDFTGYKNPAEPPSKCNGITVNEYRELYKQDGISIVYSVSGEIVFIEVGYKGYLVHYDGKECITTENGVFSLLPYEQKPAS